MKYVLMLLTVASATAFAQGSAPTMTPAECAQVTRVSPDSVRIAGPIVVAGTSLSQTTLPRQGMVINGVNIFEAIERSCFSGKAN